VRTAIPPHYLELVADAVLKSYLRKRALRLFLRRCGVSEVFLATWHEDESKRDLLHRLFPKLEDSGNDGLRLVHRMADALIQQESFPDLVGWEDSVQKIASATAAVAALRNYRETQRAEIVSEKEKAEARERAAKIGAEIKAVSWFYGVLLAAEFVHPFFKLFREGIDRWRTVNLTYRMADRLTDPSDQRHAVCPGCIGVSSVCPRICPSQNRARMASNTTPVA